MWLALDTSGDALSVAVGWPGEVAGESSVEGPRLHAQALLPTIAARLEEAGTELGDLRGVVLADGPGSFTGLRIGASAVKALARVRSLEVWTVPSLLAVAHQAAPAADGPVLAVGDALRGEIYAAMYRFPVGRVELGMDPARLTPDELPDRLPRPAAVAGHIPPAVASLVERWAPEASLHPEARVQAGTLLRLLGASGGAVRVPEGSLSEWEPAYGRPAEAQARWERDHGRSLADPSL